MVSNNNKKSNPYVGPRAFKYPETLYGRDLEMLNLLDFLIAERIILLYSPSGAGKTSLIQAALIPELKKEDFQVLPVMRVSLEPPQKMDEGFIKNRYVFSLLLSLEEGLAEEDHSPLSSLAKITLTDYLAGLAKEKNNSKSTVFIFDQFEEIFTLNPTDGNKKKEFFIQLGAMLRNSNRWAIFALREEYVASLDPYRRHIPTRLNNSFRLELLKEKTARQAMQEPARANGVDFTDDAAQKMVDDLRRVWVQQADGSKKAEIGMYVEPVQLQVSCLQLWDRLPSNNHELTEKDIKDFGDVDSALGSFYDEQVAYIAREKGIKERFIREWFQHQLITEEGVRRDVLQGPEKSQGLENSVIWSLVDTHLVRSERRRGFTWFELSHDRLIEPVRASNAAWFEVNLSLLQRQAFIWDKKGRPSDHLFRGRRLSEAEKWASEHSDELTDYESKFLSVSQETRIVEKRLRRARIIRYVIAPLIILLTFAVYQIYSYWVETRPWGYLRDLSTGKVNVMENDFVFIGRPTEYFQNQINLRPRTISRMHLVAFRDLKVMDLRSLNGSTVNSIFIPYSESLKLQDGDIVVLAGIAPLQFWNIKYSKFQFWIPSLEDSPSPSGWGMLIDGKSRNIFYLDKSEYFLCMDKKNRYFVDNCDENKALLIIRKDDEEIVTLQDQNDDADLTATMKEGDYDYNEYKIPAGRRYHSFQTIRVIKPRGKEKIEIPESHDLFEVAYKYGDHPFQIVPIIPNLEAE